METIISAKQKNNCNWASYLGTRGQPARVVWPSLHRLMFLWPDPSQPRVEQTRRRHLPFKKLYIRRGFLFDDDTVGLRVEDKGWKELSRRELTSGVLSDRRNPSSSLGGVRGKLSSSECIFFALDLRCPVRYSAQTKTKRKLFRSSTRRYAVRTRVPDAKTRIWTSTLSAIFSTSTSEIICVFNSRLPHMATIGLCGTESEEVAFFDKSVSRNSN